MLDGLLDDIFDDPPKNGEIRHNSPNFRQVETLDISGFSPDSPLSPGVSNKNDSLLADDRHYCRECSNLNSGSYYNRQRFRPVDDMPRNCGDFMPNGESAPEGLSLPEKKAILRWLIFISENSQPIIDQVLEFCANDPAYREYYLKRSKEIEK